MEKVDDILSGLESLMKKITDEEIEVYEYQRAALKTAIKDYQNEKTPLSAYEYLADWLSDQDESKKPIEVKSAMIWGGLLVVKQMGCISWSEMQAKYGKFMSDQMHLR